MTTQITANNIVPGTITSTQLTPGSLAPRIYSVAICDSSYNVLDDTAANTSGGYIQITGANFGVNSQIVINGNGTLSATYVNTTTLRAQVGAISSGTYTMYVVDTDTGATAIRVNGYTTSSFPAWGTGSDLSDQISGTSFGVNLSANSDSSITYANTTSLPTGTSLLANGYFYGTVTIGSQTTYNFTVDAKDTENQDALRTFSLTVTVSMPKLYGWGRQHYGVPNPSGFQSSSPTQIGSETNWGGNITTGGNKHALAIKSDGTLWTWGRNWGGQLGTNNTIDYSSPVQIGAGTTWLNVAAGKYFSLATKTDGTLWSWGYNGFGQLGQNVTTYRSSPTQVGTGTSWSLIQAAGKYAMSAIKTDGTLWTWGNNQNGELGLSTNTGNYKSSPTQVGTDTNWVNLPSSNGSDGGQMAAIKTNGTLWVWGQNGIGQHGTNNTSERWSPVQVGTDTNWATVACGSNHTLATKTDGTLWSWGDNSSGQLGQSSNSSPKSSPVQVGTDTNWPNSILKRDKMFAGVALSGVIRNDGTLWTWGAAVYGSTGLNNDSVYKSSPTQIGSSTKWIKITGGQTNSISAPGLGYFMMAVNDGS